MNEEFGEPEMLFNGWRSRLSHILATIVPFGYVWYRGAPIVSFTFDDFPLSAATAASDILERYAAVGTFYAATKLLGSPHALWDMASMPDLDRLVAAGHEIGLHTHEHQLLWRYTSGNFQDDLRRNTEAIKSGVKDFVPESFAYPYGVGHFSHKKWLSGQLRGSRSTRPGINSGLIDPHFLKSHPLADVALTVADVHRLIDQTAEKRGWLIFTSHDVTEIPSAYGVSPALLEAAVSYARTKTKILPVCEALDWIGVKLRPGYGTASTFGCL